ncbi:MAG: translocation/assembly module TamB [Bacteroidales bacterium]|nr:translocation/assembly module TamB [Bacteroidales bacterium]
MKKVITASLKILGWTILSLVTLLLLAALLLQTAFVKEKIARFAENQAGSFINGELSLGEIDGNFFTGISLKNILILHDGDSLVHLKEISAAYNLLALIDETLAIQSLELSNPQVFLKQINDSTWNVQQLIKASTDTTTTDTSSSNFVVKLDLLHLTEGKIRINSPDTLIPREINQFKIKLSGTYSADVQSLKMDEFSFNTQQPAISLENLAFQLQRDTEAIVLSDFILKTAKNQLQGGADYVEAPNRAGNAKLKTAPIMLSEFQFVLPDIQLPAKPIFTLDASLQGETVKAIVEIEDNAQKLHFDLSSENLYAYLFNPENTQLAYTVDGRLQNIDIAYWLNDSSLNYVINGQLNIKGQGIDPATATVNIKGDFRDLMLEERAIEQVVLEFDFVQGDLTGIVRGKGNFGQFELLSKIQQIQTKPVYQLDLSTQMLDFAALTGNDSLQSSINLHANINGRGFDPEKLSFSARLMIRNSSLQQIELDTLFADAKYSNENVTIDSLLLLTRSLVLSAQGNYSLEGRSDLDLKAQFSSLEEFEGFIPLDSLQTSGNLKASIRGTHDSLSLHTQLHLAQTSYPGYNLDSLNMNLQAYIADADTNAYLSMQAFMLSSDALSFERINVDGRASIANADTNAVVNLQAINLRNSALDLDSIVFDVEAGMDSIYIAGRIKNPDLSSSIKAGIVPGELLRITLDDLIFDYKDQHWALQSPPARLKIAPEQYIVENFNFATSSADSAQSIKASGIIDRKGTEDFSLEITKIDLKKLAELAEEDLDVSGLFSMTIGLSGEADNPILKGDFVIDKAEVNAYKLLEFDGGFNLENGNLTIEAQVIPQDNGRVEISGAMPIKLQMDSLNVAFNPADSVKGLITIERFPLAVLQTLDLTETIYGYAEAKIEVGGTLEAPKPNGRFRLVNAALKIPEYGVDYQTIALNILFEPEKVSIDTFNIKSASGNMKARGEVNFNSDFYKGNINDSKLTINFNKFNPVNHKQFNMQLSGNASLQGKTGDVVFETDLKIPKSEFNLPAIMRLFGKLNTPEMPTPLLLRELAEDEQANDSIRITQSTQKTDTAASPDYFDRLRGKAHITIPRNTWIKSEDMRIELSGDLELIKNDEFFEVFGTVDVVRGQYDLMGKTFIIDKGNITFQGGEDMMPQLDIVAAYNFRNAQREMQKLTANISGDAEEPKIEFTLDGDAINEGDAISYILFGRSLDELSLSQQDNVQVKGNLASNAAASLISSQLTKFLGDKLNVDYIEVNSSGNFDNASIAAGKYLTNNLFISYEQRIGQSNEDDLTDYEVKLEYEVFRFLFLQLNNSDRDSGFDVILKVEVE